jgi:hypothetical protein
MYCSCYSNTRVLQPSLFKKSRPEIYEGREVHQKTKNGHMDHFFGLSGTKIGLITFLIPGRDRALCRRELAVRNHLQGGVSFDDHCSINQNDKDL